MRLIDGDALIVWIKESQHMTSKMRNVICKIEAMPTVDIPPIPTGDVIWHKWELKWVLKECPEIIKQLTGKE